MIQNGFVIFTLGFPIFRQVQGKVGFLSFLTQGIEKLVGCYQSKLKGAQCKKIDEIAEAGI